ncbi:MAG: N4-gp56 family major capsid protein [Oscillospiraceae bacterium]
MAINLAEKHSSAVDEVLRKGALTTPLENSNQVDFIGAQTVKVHSMDTAEMNDYKASGSNRYGTPEELGDSVQEMTLSRKRSFTYTIDATNRLDSPEGIRDAARSLRRQLDERVIPELDGYRLATAAKNAQFVDYYTPDKSTILSQIATMNAELSNAEVPSVNRLFFTDPRIVSKLILTDELLKTSAADNAVLNGEVGRICGSTVIETPEPRLPVGAWGIIIYTGATVCPTKLAQYKIHENPPGIAGNLVEGLVYYDAFVFDKKKCGIYVGYNGGGFTISMTGTKVNKILGYPAGTFVYKAASSVTAPKPGDDLSAWTVLPADGSTTAASGNKLCVAVRGADGKCVTFSNVVTVA